MQQPILTKTALALALAALYPSLAQAAETAPMLEEVQVNAEAETDEGYRVDSTSSATRTETPLRDVPQTLNIVPGELIETQAAFSLKDALRNVPGLTIAAGEGGRTGDSITLRGFAANSDTYLDGAKDNGQYFRDTFFLERVDVLKGPSSMLFGRGATGGIVNLIAKQPHAGTAAEASVSVGPDDLQRVTVDVNGGTDAVAFRVAALHHDADSFRDENFVTREGFAPAVRLRLGEDSSFTLSGMYQKEESLFDYGVPMLNGKPAHVSRDTFYGFRDDRFQEFDVGITTAVFDIGLTDDLRLRNTTRYADYRRDYRTHLFGAITDPDPLDPRIARSQALRASNQQNIVNQTDLVFTRDLLGHENTLLFGAEFVREDVDFKSNNSTGVPDISILHPDSPPSVGAGRANDLSGVLATDRDTRARTLGVYLQDQFALTEHWKLLGGVRFDRFRAQVTEAVAATDFSEDTEFLSPRAGVVWQPTPTSSWYVSAGRSFNPSAEGLSLSISTADLEPEESTNYELGTRHEWLEGRLGFAAAVFRLDKDKARTPDPDDPSLQILAGQQVTDGVEVEINGQLTDSLRVFASSAWLDAEIEKSNTPDTEGKRPSNVAKQQGVVWADWAFAPRWTLGGGMYFVSSRYTDNANTAELPGYERFDMTLGYQLTHWLFQINFQNLTDEHYYESGQSRSALPGAPRALVFTFRASF